MDTLKKEELYRQAQALFIEENKLKIGSKVKVLRKAPDNEMGWPTFWNDKMDNSVGEELSVCQFVDTYSDKTFGIRLSDSYWYPWFVLEPCKFEPIVLDLTDDYDAAIQEDGTVKVGCQTIPFEKLEEVFLAAQKQVNNQ